MARRTSGAVGQCPGRTHLNPTAAAPDARGELSGHRQEALVHIARAFGRNPDNASFRHLGKGRINTTVLATYTDGGRLVHQRLNTDVFREPDKLMDNVRRVGEHLAGRLPAPLRALVPLPTADGALLVTDPQGGVWRTYPFVDHGLPLPATATPAQVEAAARAYGRFAAHLADLPPPPLHETLPGFHDTPARLAALEEALAAGRPGREAAALARALLERSETARLIGAPLAAGRLPRRVAHNDTKLDNILVHQETGEPLCVVDLDTVMTGTVLHDFGDFVRSAAAAGTEDGSGPLTLDLERFAAAARGYLAGCGEMLTDPERALLAASPRVITLELAARFLTDHLEGDRYFPVEQPGDNLRRARRQVALLEAMEVHKDHMERVVLSSS